MTSGVQGHGSEVLAFLERHWLVLSLVGSLAASPLLYLALATSLPGLALLTSSLFMLAAFVFFAAIAWRMGSYITWQRRLEVFGYRALAGLGAYLALGILVVLLLNMFSPRTIPLEWPTAQRYVPFWPFYTWFVVGCELLGWFPCPPPPG